MLVFPITKYEKGFFTHTFYSRTTIENKPYDLRFKIDYLNHTVTVEDVETLNQRIKNINSKIVRPAVRKYDYSQINEAGYFDDIENRTLNLRLKEKVKGIDRKIIITLSDQDLKFTL